VSAEHPAERYERSVVELGTRAKLACLALGASALGELYDLAAREWSIHLLREYSSADPATQVALYPGLESADRLVNFGAVASLVILVVTATLFLRWVHRVVSLTRALGDVHLSWSPSQAAWAFIIPFVSLYRPYRVLSELQQKLDPDDILPPAPRVDRDAQSDYRSVALVTPPAPKPVPRALLGLWWGCFIASRLISRLSSKLQEAAEGIESVISTYHGQMLASALAVAAAALAIGVVRSLNARLDERFRRIRYSTPEALAEQRINVR